MRFAPASGQLPSNEATLTPDGGGRYTLKSSNLSLLDDWQLQALVRREGQSDVTATFEVRPAPKPSTGDLPWHRIAGGFLLAGALLYLLALNPLSQSQAQLIAYGVIPALALAVISVIVFFLDPITVPAGLVNPIPPTADSIARGQALYTTNCFPCHGATGKGDGPIGLTLSPGPTDLTQFTGRDANSDEQLWLWISDGVPETIMPAFQTSLTDDERWHLVNYIRTLNQR